MTQSKTTSGPLTGLLVIDFTAFESGPLSTMLLADQGARVIKVEPPTGDAVRSIGYGHNERPDLFEEKITAAFQQFNRGKESVTLNLKDPDENALAKKLIAKADVVVENYRPGVMKKLGLDYDTAKALNPSLIYVSISGYGQFGEFATNAAFDVVVQATSGFMSATGQVGGKPTKSGPSIADAGASIYGYAALLTALYGREKTGQGCQVDVSMQDALMMAQSDAICMSFITGEPATLDGNEFPLLHPFGVFDCKDDTPLALCIGAPHQFTDLVTAMGHPEWAKDERFTFPEGVASTHREEFNALFKPELATKTAKEWKVIFDKVKLPVNILYDYIELANSEFLQDRKIVAEYKGMKVVGNPMKLSAYPDPADSLRGAPTLGEHNDAIKKEFG
ncbi:MAG: CoA transferase [Deltaproteobacteria bacterium]|nr:CoA transferase [Deltaproteobacteria bacterium]